MSVHHARHKELFLIQVWEQEFAWTAANKPIKVAARALTVPGDHKLNKQPIFCFETMMHMLYWSSLVYDYKRVCSCLHGRCPHRVNEDAALTNLQGSQGSQHPQAKA